MELLKAPQGKERNLRLFPSKPKTFSNYVALMCDLVDQEPTNYEEAVHKKEWEEAMIAELCMGYSSQTRRKEYSILQMDIKNKACS